MFNLSLTACSFYLKKRNSRGEEHIYALNSSVRGESEDGNAYSFEDCEGMFRSFFQNYTSIQIDDDKQQTFKCDFDSYTYVDDENFRMYYIKILSGNYGSASDILDSDSQKIVYQKKASDIDTRPFYLFIIFPKDNKKVTVQKGMLIFQNVGPLGIKTITTSLIKKYFAEKFKSTLICSTISVDLFIKKIIKKENIKKLRITRNLRPSDTADRIYKGYGHETRELKNLNFSDDIWTKIISNIHWMAGHRSSVFEFEDIDYDNLKLIVDVGGRDRTIDIHNLSNLSIIEAIPDDIRMADGHPNLPKLVDHFKLVTNEYLNEMVLTIIP